MIYEDYNSVKEYEVLMLRGEKGAKGDKGDPGQDGAPGATGQGAWGTIEGTITDQTDLMELIDEASENATFNSELIVTVEPEYVGTIKVPSGYMAQGFTCNDDGSIFYQAIIETSDLMSNPKIQVVNSANINPTTEIDPEDSQYASVIPLSKKGHYNCLDYLSRDGKNYLYATGFAANGSENADTYSHIYRYNLTDSTGTLMNTGVWYWNYLFGTGANGIPYTVAHMGSYRAWDVRVYPGFYWMNSPFSSHSEITNNNFYKNGYGRYYPFTRCSFEHFNGIEQGGCIKDPYTVFTVIASTRSVNPSGAHSANQIMVRSITGDLLKQIMIKLPQNDELEDCLITGNNLYINTGTGRIYKISGITDYYRTYYEDNTMPRNWRKPCYLYINEFFSETYTSATSNYDGQTYKILRDFELSPLTTQELLENATVFYSVNNRQYYDKINPKSKNFTLTCTYTWDNYRYTVSFMYTKYSNDTHYWYHLTNIYGVKTDANGNSTYYHHSDPQISACLLIQNSFFYDNMYIHSIVGDPTIPYTYDPLDLW